MVLRSQSSFGRSVSANGRDMFFASFHRNPRSNIALGSYNHLLVRCVEALGQGFYGLSAIKPEKLCPASGLHSPRNKLVTRPLLLLLLAGISGLTAGCALLRIGGGGAGKASAQPRLVQEQIELQRFADDFFARGGQGIDESAERLGTDAGRQQVVQIKLLLGSSVLSIVSGPNPNANLRPGIHHRPYPAVHSRLLDAHNQRRRLSTVARR
jgi:hypothetical protein